MDPPARKHLHRSGRRQTTRPAAARESHQKRLGHVVLLMAKPDDACVLFQERHSRGPRLRLARSGTRLAPAFADERDLEFPRYPTAKRRVRA
jgi:hypothetical protein